MTRWIIFVVIVLLVDLYTYQSIKTISRNVWLGLLYWLVSFAILFNFVYRLYTFDRSVGISQTVMLSIGLFILLFIPKILSVAVLLIEDVFRLSVAAKNLISKSSDGQFFPDRRLFISQLALGVAAIPFSSILYGMVKGKYNFKVIEHTLFFDDLPAAFDGFTISHISDIHSGSFDNKEKIAYGIDLINDQGSDMILFTGDLVNSKAEEMDPWIPYFSRLKSQFGNYSILGNHDYGEYVSWKNRQEKELNFEGIKNAHSKIGFNLLLNDSVYIEKGSDKIALVGVENWGTRFKKAGDLRKASEKINSDDFKILMSHDPSHWEQEVKNHANKYHLTLSGHTHGMQFGIEIPGIKWSPVKYFYKYWAGMYREMGKYLNVNRGFGYLAFPGRVGIWPEITVITLKNKKLQSYND